MPRKGLTMVRIHEVLRLIQEGLSDRQIARALSLRRSRVAEIRGLGNEAPTVLGAAAIPEPLWTNGVDWNAVDREIREGHDLKRIWEDRATERTSYSNFWKYLNRRFAPLLKETVTLREFEPGGHCEVDYSGDPVVWWDDRNRPLKAQIFVGILCHSQLLFAFATVDQKKASWLLAHQKMYAFFGGVSRVTVPDNTKTGVLKAHLYDPDLNPAYLDLAIHYGTAVVPARAGRPRDKSFVEGAIGILQRHIRWSFRNRRFRSLAEVNAALSALIARINDRSHTRFRISRRERFERTEKNALKPLPEEPYCLIDWKVCRVHPDSTIALEGAYYSVPFLHRGKEVRVRLSSRQVEIFVETERVALHGRYFGHSGHRIVDPAHLPPNSQAYRETTPQFLLSQARGLSPALGSLVEDLFQEDSLAHLRRVQGLIRTARTERDHLAPDRADAVLEQAVDLLRSRGTIRVRLFQAILQGLRTQPPALPDRTLHRRPGNPMLRSTSVPPASTLTKETV